MPPSPKRAFGGLWRQFQLSQLEAAGPGAQRLVETRDSAAQAPARRKLLSEASPSPNATVPRSVRRVQCKQRRSQLKHQQSPLPAFRRRASQSAPLVVRVLTCEMGIIPVFRVRVPFGGVFLHSVSKVPALENVPQYCLLL